jgi:hypothetical protein
VYIHIIHPSNPLFHNSVLSAIMSGAVSFRSSWFQGFVSPSAGTPRLRKPASIRGVKIACSFLAQNATLLLLCSAVDHFHFSPFGRKRGGAWGDEGDHDGFGGVRFAAVASGVAEAGKIAVVPEGLPKVAEIPPPQDEE